MHVEDKVGAAMGVGRRLRRHAIYLSAQLPQEDLTVRRRYLGCGVDYDVQELVAQLHQVVGLPIVPSPRRQQRVKRPLKVDVGRGADVFAVGITKATKGRDQPLALHHVPRVASGQYDDVLPMYFLGKEGQRGRLPKYHPDC